MWVKDLKCMHYFWHVKKKFISRWMSQYTLVSTHKRHTNPTCHLKINKKKKKKIPLNPKANLCASTLSRKFSFNLCVSLFCAL